VQRRDPSVDQTGRPGMAQDVRAEMDARGGRRADRGFRTPRWSTPLGDAERDVGPLPRERPPVAGFAALGRARSGSSRAAAAAGCCTTCGRPRFAAGNSWCSRGRGRSPSRPRGADAR
jgi:hypothetical protein